MKQTQTVEQEKARLICGNVETIRDGVIVPMETKPPGDWAMMQMLE